MRPIKSVYPFFKKTFLSLLLLGLYLSTNAQFFQLPSYQKRQAIPFKFIKNLIIVPVSINGEGPFNFVLDTGVGLVLISDYTLAERLKLRNLRNIKIIGLGEQEELDAFITPPLTLKLGNAQGEYIPAAILKKDAFNLSEYVGMPIHGLLGYEFFSSFITRINYPEQLLTIYRFSVGYIPRKGYKIPLSIEERKPYIETNLTLATGQAIRAKFIIDTGAGHPVSLENNLGLPFPIPEVNIEANLGVGLAGPIQGYLGRIPVLYLGKFPLKNVITAFPNYNDVGAKINITGRTGNLGNQILKRFETVIDYSRHALYIKPSAYFRDNFEHDMSGLEFFRPAPDFTRLIISRVAPDSAAEIEGLEAGDEILSINLKSIANYSSGELDNLFRAGNERSYLMEIVPRDEKNSRKIIFTLKRRI